MSHPLRNSTMIPNCSIFVWAGILDHYLAVLSSLFRTFTMVFDFHEKHMVLMLS
jgi:hypothetical protein